MVYPTPPTAPPPLHSFCSKRKQMTSSNCAIAGSSVCAIANSAAAAAAAANGGSSSEVNGNCTGTAETYITGEEIR